MKNIITQSPLFFSYTPDNLLRFIWCRHIYLDLCLLADTAMLVNLAQSRQYWLQTLQSYCAGSRVPALHLVFSPWDTPLTRGAVTSSPEQYHNAPVQAEFSMGLERNVGCAPLPSQR